MSDEKLDHSNGHEPTRPGCCCSEVTNGLRSQDGCCPMAREFSESTEAMLDSMSYSTHLHLDQLLGACQPLSFQPDLAPPVHDEHFFIITHQVFELWFKAMLFELDSVIGIFSNPSVTEHQMLTVASRLRRVVAILRSCAGQFEILETMAPVDFLEFRIVLKRASAFQSVQFRLLENKLGVLHSNRVQNANMDYKEYLTRPKDVQLASESETGMSLFASVEKWLEGIPGSSDDHYWAQFHQGAQQWISDTYARPLKAADNPMKRTGLEEEVSKQEAVFERLFNPSVYETMREKGEIRLSHSAFLGGLFIVLWRHEPRLCLPYEILSLLMDIDSLVGKFRYAHVMMVHRMLGVKPGTGGSSGYHYLCKTIGDRYKVFTDIFNLSTYVIPRMYLPPLPETTHRRLACWNLDKNACPGHGKLASETGKPE